MSENITRGSTFPKEGQSGLMEAQIITQPSGKRFNTMLGQTIFQALEGEEEIFSICGGRGTCGKCKVSISKGHVMLSNLSNNEKQLLSPDEVNEKYRLACCSKIERSGKISVFIPKASRISRVRLFSQGVDRKVKFNPTVKIMHIVVKKPNLLDLRSDVDRFLHAIECVRHKGYTIIPYPLLKELPSILRKSSWDVSTAIWNDEKILGIEGYSSERKCYGIAVDIGTSKVSCYIVDLLNGEDLYVDSMLNSQLPYGEDIMSRISFVSDSPERLDFLHSRIINCINTLIRRACNKLSIKRRQIYEITIAGNSAMHHIFLGVSPKWLALSPYVPVATTSFDLRAGDLNIKINPNGNVHVLPIIAGFVGGDAIADILATGIDKVDEFSLLLDIGTNTEIIQVPPGPHSYVVRCFSLPQVAEP